MCSFHCKFFGLCFRYYLLLFGEIVDEVVDRLIYIVVRFLDSPEQLDRDVLHVGAVVVVIFNELHLCHQGGFLLAEAPVLLGLFQEDLIFICFLFRFQIDFLLDLVDFLLQLGNLNFGLFVVVGVLGDLLGFEEEALLQVYVLAAEGVKLFFLFDELVRRFFVKRAEHLFLGHEVSDDF